MNTEKKSPAEGDATPCGWFEGPHGAFRANPAFKMEWPPQSLMWQVPVYLHTQPQPKGTAGSLTEKQIERAWRLGFRHACDAERLNATEEWGYKGANVIEDVQGLVDVARGVRAHVARQAQAPAVQDGNEDLLLNLLAVIHGDGGHHTTEHGLAKSAEYAEKLVADWRAQRSTARVTAGWKNSPTPKSAP